MVDFNKLREKNAAERAAAPAELPPDHLVMDAEESLPKPPEPYVEIPEVLSSARTFLSGEAGTGKTYLARAMQRQWKGTVLASTTGIAAVNLGEGTTINALLRYFDTASLRDAYLQGKLTSRLCKLAAIGVQRILIDEVSMMDANQLTILTDALNEMNGDGYVLDADTAERLAAKDLNPISLVLVGDFAQLPPVKAPFAFESAHWKPYAEHTHKLTEIRRQAQREFIEALQATRRGDAQHACDFFGPRMQAVSDPDFEGTTILATNDAVARFNHLRLQKLPTEVVTFASTRWGVEMGDWKQIPEKFDLKEGALIMLLANKREMGEEGEPGPLVYANGDLGYVTHLDPRGWVYVKLQRSGEEIGVDWVTRDNYVPLEPGRKKQLKQEGKESLLSPDGKQERVGQVTYLPIRLAYATTVHKSQGLSLDNVQVDIREGFFKAPSMVYVALSRARSVEGLRLVGNNSYLKGRCTVDARIKPWL